MNYDPMNYVTQPGNAIAQISSTIGNTIESLPSILKQNKEYQLLQQKLQSEEKIAESAYTGMNSLLLDMGANKKVRAPNQGEATDDYLKYIAQEVSSLATDENGGLSPQKLQQLQQRVSQIGLGLDAGVKESIARQRQINKYDPMSTIQLNKDTVQPESMPLRAQIGEGDIGRTPMTGRSSSFDPITGVGIDAETGTVNTPTPVQKKYDPLEDVETSLLSALKNGDISASKFAEQKLNIATTRGKMNYDEGQAGEQRGRDTNEANAKDIVAKIGEYEILKDNVIVSNPNPSDIRDNPRAYSIGEAILKPDTGSGRNGSGSGSTKEPVSKLRDKRDKTINDMKSLVDIDNNPLPGAESSYKDSLRELRILTSASKIQDMKGGIGGVSDDDAIKKGREFVELYDVVKPIVEAMNSGSPGIKALNPREQLQYFNSMLASATPEVKNKIVAAIEEGAKFEEILAELEKGL